MAYVHGLQEQYADQTNQKFDINPHHNQSKAEEQDEQLITECNRFLEPKTNEAKNRFVHIYNHFSTLCLCNHPFHLSDPHDLHK